MEMLSLYLFLAGERKELELPNELRSYSILIIDKYF